MSTDPKIIYAGISDTGKVRSENQDSFGKFPKEDNPTELQKGQMFIVADGMGGHKEGKKASQTAIDLIHRVYYELPEKSIIERLHFAFENANFHIFHLSKGKMQFQKMGTTCSLLLIFKNQAHIAHVGDSRIFRIRRQKIEQLTEDHSWVAEMEKKGVLSEEEAKDHPERSVLLRALGIKSEVKVDIISDIDLSADDIFILCTDGLSEVSLDELKSIAVDNTPQIACQKLVDLANERGGNDNVTVQIVRIVGKSLPQRAPNEPLVKTGLRNYRLAGISVVLIILCALIIFIYKDDIIKSDLSEQHDLADQSLEKLNKNKIIPILSIADSLYQVGNLALSLDYYREGLNYPHLRARAQNGIDNIADIYMSHAKLHMKNYQYNQAYNEYQKISEIWPDNIFIKNQMNICLQFMNNSNMSEDSISNFEQQKEPTNVDLTTWDSPNTIVQGWNFFNQQESVDYKWNKSNFLFLENNRSKTAILDTINAKNVYISVHVKYISGNTKAHYGVIIGYLGKNKEFFKFTTNSFGDYYLLSNIAGNNEIIQSGRYNTRILNPSMDFNIKVKIVDSWIVTYMNDKPLKAWDSNRILDGKCGLYAQPGITVEFSNFMIQPVGMEY